MSAPPPPPASDQTLSKGCLGVIGFFLPPAAVFLVRGCGASFWINLVLYFILWLPASVHAIYIVCKEAPPKLNVAQTTNYQDRYQNAPPAAPGAASWPQEQGAAQQAYPPPPGPAPTQETYLDHPVEKPAL